jgi:glycosyltransferase involved in cell wall biosynthesis
VSYTPAVENVRPLRVLALPRYGRAGASSRYRFLQYLPGLRQAGVDVTVSRLLSDDYVEALYSRRRYGWPSILGGYLRRLRELLSGRRFDLLWIEGELFPWAPAIAERLLASAGTPYVVDYDDAIFHRYDQHASRIVRGLLARKIDVVMRRARLVVAGSDYLAQRAVAAGASRVERLPTVVDHERYLTPERVRRHGAFALGWIGSPSTQHYLETIREPLAQLTRAGVCIVVIGAHPSFRIEGVDLTLVPWTAETELQELGSLDVGMMPLIDDPWSRGKCGFKLIQYMASGLPVVASPVGENCRIVQEGVTGYLCSTPQQWVDAVLRLRQDGALRERMAMEGRRRVELEFSVQSALPRLGAWLRAAAEGKN